MDLFLASIFYDASIPWIYNVIIDLFIVFLIFIIGLPTVYAMFFGAPWVPTPMIAVRKMVKSANLKDGMTICDLGCGDGRLVFEASNVANVKAIGYEISPLPFFYAFVKKIVSRSRAKILFKSFWKIDLGESDVVFLYLLPKCIDNLVIKMKKEMKKGSKVISYAFKIKDLELVENIEKDKINNICSIWVYKI